MTKSKVCQNSAEITTDNGEITFVAARSVKNLNGYTYDVKSLQVQNASGDYSVISNEGTEVAIPLMLDHSSNTREKIGNIDSAKIETVDGIDQVVMHAKFFNSDESQEVRQRILDSELTDVSITTDWGDVDYLDSEDEMVINNAHVIEVSVVYAGAEPKAKILAKNSVDTDEATEEAESTEDVEEKTQDTEEPPAEEESQEETEDAEELTNEEEESEMANQPTNDAADKVADKSMVLNALSKLAQTNAIKGMNRSQVIEAVRNAVTLLDADGETAYVVPDAVFTEILAVERPTDLLDTFQTVPVKRFTLMSEVPSDADLARAGRWSKGEQKQIQTSDLAAQKFATQFLYKMQEISYEDMQEDFGDLLLAFIHQELPQKVSEEEERDFIVGDGRASNAPRHNSSIVSLDSAAADTDNVHVVTYDGSGDASDLVAAMNGLGKIYEEGVVYAVMNKKTLGGFRQAGLSTASGLPFSTETVSEALGVQKIFTREYVADNVVYAYVGSKVKRLTGGRAGETIEQYDIDYNNRKIEFIRPVGGGASGLASAVKVTLPGTVSA